MYEIDAIELIYLRELIPNILFNKFQLLNLKTVADIRNSSVEDFSSNYSIGITTISKLQEFQEIISTNEELIISTYNKNCPKVIPRLFEEDKNFVEIFKNLIEDILLTLASNIYKTSSTKSRYQRNIDIIRKFYGLSSKKYEMDQIAIRHRINRETVRLIIQNDFIKNLKIILNGSILTEWNCYCRPEVIDLIQSFKKDLAGLPVLSEYKIETWLKEYGIEFQDDNLNYFIILLKIWGYERIPLSRHYQLQENVFYADDSVNHRTFLEVSTMILIFLKKKVIPVPFDDIVITVLEEFDIEDDFIRLICNVNSEIEQIGDSYQIRFDKLSSINDYTYRILFERQKALTYNELLYLINQKLFKHNKGITLDSLKQTLRRDDFIVPIGKSGIWSLKNLNLNTDSQVDLIVKTLRTVDTPSKINEITQYINETFGRRDISSRSIGSNLLNYKKHFIKLQGNRYALVEMSHKYKDEVIKNTVPSRKKSFSKSEEISSKIIEILKTAPSNKMILKDLIKIIHQTNGHFSKMSIYKSINEHPLLFRKENINSRDKNITLFSNTLSNEHEIITKYKWNDLKKILERELNPIFNSSIQPTYPISLSIALDKFFEVITKDVSVGCPELSDLADRILPTLNKFYIGASDRNDKLNFLKQIVTSQESFFKKLLFIINSAVYMRLRSSKKGFGSVIENLNKIDPKSNRYKDIKNASNFEFGKHCSRAYNYRNLDTHNAKGWTETEIIETKTSCLVFMIYGIFEYRNEII